MGENAQRIGNTPSETFCEVKPILKVRGLSSLMRGWHTPDPSPRASLGLPKCVAKDFLVNYPSSDTASTRTPSPSSSVTKEDDSRFRFRTPSPVYKYRSGGGVLPSLPLREPIILSTMPRMPGNTHEPRASVADEMIDMAFPSSENIFWPSHGSIGHPFSCSNPCKYFRKARGCKDGENCDHCHLCEWTQCHQRRQAGEKRESRRKALNRQLEQPL
jgi:hypothetical protein